MKQLNKFNMCIYCQACNSTCKYGALQVLNNNYFIDEKNVCTVYIVLRNLIKDV